MDCFSLAVVMRQLYCDCRLDSDGNIKVGDFGLAEDVYSCGYFRQNWKGNIKLPYKWMALESLSDNLFSEKTDVVCKGSLNFGDRVKFGHLYYFYSRSSSK